MKKKIGHGWDEIIEQTNARAASIGTRCVEHLGRNIELKIPEKAFVYELATPLSLSCRLWLNRPVDRQARKQRLAVAERLLKELDRAAAAGLDGATLQQLRENTQQTIGNCKFSLQKTDYSDFILACAMAYVTAFDKRPGRSQGRDADGKAIEGGPFIDFAFFILCESSQPLIEKATLARYVAKAGNKLDRIWKRHKRLKATT